MSDEKTNVVQLWELIVATFDSAALFSSDPQEVSRMAAETVMSMLRRQRHRTRGYHILMEAGKSEPTDW